MSVASRPPAIHIENLRIDRGGRTVIDTMTLSVPAGIITGLLGPSGCGKTTLMRTIVGAQNITAGSATVFGHPAGARILRRHIGYVTQSPSIYPDLTTVENVRYFARLYGVGKGRVREVIDAVGLTTKKSELAGNLSGGQKGRVSLACALVCDPDLLILDEPTVGLDPVLRAELWEQFAAFANRGKTLLISSHAMDEARHCAGLILMRDGAILAHAAPNDIMRRTNCANLESAFLSLVRHDHPRYHSTPNYPTNPHHSTPNYRPSPNYLHPGSHQSTPNYPSNSQRSTPNYRPSPNYPTNSHPATQNYHYSPNYHATPNYHYGPNYSHFTPEAGS
jgi:ABC-2 type transport system ATP-binding protein